MTCYENLRKNSSDPELFKRLENYLRAVDDDKVEEYHDKRKHHKEKKGIDEY